MFDGIVKSKSVIARGIAAERNQPASHDFFGSESVARLDPCPGSVDAHQKRVGAKHHNRQRITGGGIQSVARMDNLLLLRFNIG